MIQTDADIDFIDTNCKYCTYFRETIIDLNVKDLLTRFKKIIYGSIQESRQYQQTSLLITFVI